MSLLQRFSSLVPRSVMTMPVSLLRMASFTSPSLAAGVEAAHQKGHGLLPIQ